MRRNPFEELEAMFDRMGRQLDGDALPEFQSVPVDLKDHGDEYVLVADLPGYDVEHVDLTFADGNVRIDASRESVTEATDEETGEYVHEERAESVSRSVRVPDPVVEDEITASYENGMLTVTLPKEGGEVEEGHHIDIN